MEFEFLVLNWLNTLEKLNLFWLKDVLAYFQMMLRNYPK